MAQFDVFKNNNLQTAERFPYLIEVQSDIFESSTRSVYVPLILANALSKPDKTLNFEFTMDDKSLRFFPLDISSAPRDVVGECVGSLKHESDTVIGALDLLFARY